MISSSQRLLPDNTQHSQQTNIHSPGGIRTHNLSRRAAADLRLRPCSHWDRQISANSFHKIHASQVRLLLTNASCSRFWALFPICVQSVEGNHHHEQQQQQQRRTGPAPWELNVPRVVSGEGCFRPSEEGAIRLSLSCNSGRVTSDWSDLTVP